jgi:hypothetical protein
MPLRRVAPDFAGRSGHPSRADLSPSPRVDVMGHKQTKCVAVKSRPFNRLVGDREKFEPSYKAAGRSRVLGRPVVADFNPLGQKLEEDTDPNRQEPTLPKIDGMQFVDVAGVEFLENGDKPIGGDIVLDDE